MTVVAYAAADQVGGPVRRRNVFLGVVAAALTVIVAVAFVGVIAARRLAEDESVNDAAKTADLLAESVVQPVLADGLLTGDPGALAAIGAVVTQRVLSATVLRVKIWTPTGRIVYSDEPRLIGRVFPLGDDERGVLTNPRIRADVSDLRAPENEYEQGNVKLLEVYRPVWTPTGRPLLFETYFRYDEVTARSGQLWRGFAGVTLSSMLLLLLLLLPVLWRLLDRLRRSQDQREALLQKAVDASQAERRRIAGTLHDGVVQDLAATSFAVAGSAERAAGLGHRELASTLQSAAATVRTSIGGLRSLLVDIYPPSLASAGLAAALGDLTASARSRGIVVTLDLTPDCVPDATAERLIYRVTQECLNNVVKHAQAATSSCASPAPTTRWFSTSGTTVSASMRPARWPSLRRATSAFGFSPTSPPRREQNCGCATAPGAGTQWQLRIPEQ